MEVPELGGGVAPVDARGEGRGGEEEPPVGGHRGRGAGGHRDGDEEREGDEVEGATVSRIEPSGVVFRYQGREIRRKVGTR